MTLSFEQVVHAYSRLAPRERLLLHAAAGAAVLTVLYFGVATVSGERAELERRLARKERQIEEIADLRLRYLELEQRRRGSGSTDLPEGFSLFTFLDGVASRAVTREKIRRMSPSARRLGELDEESVEMQMLGVSLDEMVQLLYQVESSEAPVYVSRILMKKRFNDPHSFDVTVVVSALRRTA